MRMLTLEKYHKQLENKNFLYDNCDLIWRCAERADLIREYQEADILIEVENLWLEVENLLLKYEYELNLDSYISNLLSKSEVESRELGFL